MCERRGEQSSQLAEKNQLSICIFSPNLLVFFSTCLQAKCVRWVMPKFLNAHFLFQTTRHNDSKRSELFKASSNTSQFRKEHAIHVTVTRSPKTIRVRTVRVPKTAYLADHGRKYSRASPYITANISYPQHRCPTTRTRLQTTHIGSPFPGQHRGDNSDVHPAASVLTHSALAEVTKPRACDIASRRDSQPKFATRSRTDAKILRRNAVWCRVRARRGMSIERLARWDE